MSKPTGLPLTIESDSTREVVEVAVFNCRNELHNTHYQYQDCPDCRADFLVRYAGSDEQLGGRKASSLIGLMELAEWFGITAIEANIWAHEGRLPAEDYGNQWWFRLGDANQLMSRQSRTRAIGSRISSTPILLYLDEHGRATVDELAAAFRLHHGRVRRQLRGLEKVQLVIQKLDGSWVLAVGGIEYVRKIPKAQRHSGQHSSQRVR